MRSFFDIFVDVMAREPTQRELSRVTALAGALDLKRDDPFLLLICVLVGFGGDYAQIPGKIDESVQKICALAVKQAETSISRIKKVSESSIQAALEKAVAESAEKAARASGARTWGLWIAGAVAVCFFCFGIFGGFMFGQGRQAGYDKGFAAARNEAIVLRERDAFYSTPLGAKLFEWYKSGKLEKVMAFLESPGGEVAQTYTSQDLENILLCHFKDRVLKKHEDGLACYPTKGSGYFIPVKAAEKIGFLDKLLK